MTKKNFSYLLIIILLIIFVPKISFGQVALDGNFLEMSMIPENPEPFQKVQLTLKSFSYDLDRSKITWQIDGVDKKTEIGLKEFNTQAGKNGQETDIKVIVETPNDGTKELEAFFIPSVVDLIYEALAYTPPFYKGRALNPNQGVVLVEAIPELIRPTGEKIAITDVVYNWKQNGVSQANASGLGRNTFVFSGTVPIKDNSVEVNASSLDGSIYASKEINIPNVSPKIIFYENSPIYGIMFNKAIKDTVKMLTDEFSVLAIPYFFSASTANSSDLNYTWSLNNEVVSSQEPVNSFTTRLVKVGGGLANINLKITNAMRLFQFTDKSYSINFNKQ